MPGASGWIESGVVGAVLAGRGDGLCVRFGAVLVGRGVGRADQIVCGLAAAFAAFGREVVCGSALVFGSAGVVGVVDADVAGDGCGGDDIISTLPKQTSKWLRRDLIRRVESLGRPVTAAVPGQKKGIDWDSPEVRSGVGLTLGGGG